MDELLLTVADVADLFGWTERYVRDLCREGGLPHIRVGQGRGSIRFRREDLDAYIEARSEGRAVGITATSAATASAIDTERENDNA